MASVAERLEAISDDEWQRRATADAILAAREVVGKHGINSRALISSLSEVEWGWICAASIFAWIKTRAQQAVVEGSSYELPIRSLKGPDPEPWESGAVETILPALGGLGLDWEKPLGEWSKDQIISLAWQMHKLTSAALAARDECTTGKLVNYDKERAEREVSARAGGGLMSRKEMDDDIPF